MDFIKLILLFLLRIASQPVSWSALLCIVFLLWYYMPSSNWYSPSVVPKSSSSPRCVLRPYLRYREIRRVLVDLAKRSTNVDRTSSTYSLVQVDGVLAGDNVGNGRALLLLGLDVGHF